MGAVASSSSPPSRIIMTGLDAAGKTTLMYKMKRGEVTTSIPTIGFNLESLTLNRKTDLLSWDVGGRSPMRPLWRHFLNGAQGFVFVVDSADRERMEAAAEELDKFVSEEELRHCPVLLLANKRDLPGAASLADVEEAMRLPQLRQRAGGRPCAAFAVCAVTFAGVDEAFEWLHRQIRLQRESLEREAAAAADNAPPGLGKSLARVADNYLPKVLQRCLFN